MTHTENVEPKTEYFLYIPLGFFFVVCFCFYFFIFIFYFVCVSVCESLAANCIPDAYEKTFPTVQRDTTPYF